jgi:hypothetical protein
MHGGVPGYLLFVYRHLKGGRSRSFCKETRHRSALPRDTFTNYRLMLKLRVLCPRQRIVNFLDINSSLSPPFAPITRPSSILRQCLSSCNQREKAAQTQ